LRFNLLKEALGQSILAKIDLTGLNFHKNDAKSSVTSGFTTEIGKIDFTQVLGEPKQGQLLIQAKGDYQKMLTGSGPQLLYLNPLVLDIDYKGYAPPSSCTQGAQLTGKVRCTLALMYAYAANVVDLSGQCISHRDGILDNVQVTLGGDTHRIRYDLAVKGNGLGREFKSYQWLGAASFDGNAVVLTHINDSPEKCDK
jgi:hypothetical protein